MNGISGSGESRPGLRTNGHPPRLRNPMLQAAQNAWAMPVARGLGRTGPATGLAVAVNLLVGVGLLVGLWPAGNVVLLFWFETGVIFAGSVARILTAERPDPFRPVEIFSVPVDRPALTAVFALHYGVLSVLCLAWCSFVAHHVGWVAGLLALGLPAVLVTLRYVIETGSTWFGPDGQRWRLTVPQAMTQPFPRLFVLVATSMSAFAAVQVGLNGGTTAEDWTAVADPLVDRLPDLARTPGTLVVLVLLVLRTPLDVWVTRRSVTR